MGNFYVDNRPKIRKSSNIITVAAGATPEVLYQLSQGGANPRTCILRKIHAYNAVGATTLMIGTGLAAAWVQQWPTFRLINNMDNEWTEDEICELELGADLTVQADVLGVLVQIEVDEIGS